MKVRTVLSLVLLVGCEEPDGGSKSTPSLDTSDATENGTGGTGATASTSLDPEATALIDLYYREGSNEIEMVFELVNGDPNSGSRVADAVVVGPNDYRQDGTDWISLRHMGCHDGTNDAIVLTDRPINLHFYAPVVEEQYTGTVNIDFSASCDAAGDSFPLRCGLDDVNGTHLAVNEGADDGGILQGEIDSLLACRDESQTFLGTLRFDATFTARRDVP